LIDRLIGLTAGNSFDYLIKFLLIISKNPEKNISLYDKIFSFISIAKFLCIIRISIINDIELPDIESSVTLLTQQIMKSNMPHYSLHETHDLIKKGANAMKESEYRPDIIVAIGGGGGLTAAQFLQTELDSTTIPIYVVGSPDYLKENNDKKEDGSGQWIEPRILEQWKRIEPKILLVDEVAETKRTLFLVKQRLLENFDTGANMFRNIVSFVVHDKRPAPAKSEPMSYLDRNIGLYFACNPSDYIDILINKIMN
jgi:hypoxanthine phosphoribosyltransferase